MECDLANRGGLKLNPETERPRGKTRNYIFLFILRRLFWDGMEESFPSRLAYHLKEYGKYLFKFELNNDEEDPERGGHENGEEKEASDNEEGSSLMEEGEEAEEVFLPPSAEGGRGRLQSAGTPSGPAP